MDNLDEQLAGTEGQEMRWNKEGKGWPKLGVKEYILDLTNEKMRKEEGGEETVGRKMWRQ